MKNHKEIFSLDAYDTVTEESIDEYSGYGSTVYESEAEALEAAAAWRDELVRWIENPTDIGIIYGQYQTPAGDVYGEPLLITAYRAEPKAKAEAPCHD